MNTKQLILWRRTRRSLVVSTMFLAALTTIAFGQTFTGTVTDATTKKPSVGDEIVLLDFSSGIREMKRTQSDAKGRFTVKVDDSKKPAIFQVIHQGESYYKAVLPGTSDVHLEVYDVSKKLKGIAVTADVMRVQVKGDSLQAVRLFAVKNNSSPPQTEMSDHSFEFYVPPGAQIDLCMARSVGGPPVRTFPLPQKEKNLYAFTFPLRPGETQFQVLFHMPYKGEVTINPKSVYGVDHFVVMLPKSMQFSAPLGSRFQAMTDPRQRDAIVQVASNTKVGQPLTFTLSGAGALSETKAENARKVQATTAQKSSTTVPDPRAAIGVVRPALPHQSERVQWYIVGGLGVLLVAGTMSIARRSTKREASHSVPAELKDKVLGSRTTSEPGDGSKSILNDLKEQLFRLEVKHKQNQISQREYEKAMTALRQNLDWAIRQDDGKALS